MSARSRSRRRGIFFAANSATRGFTISASDAATTLSSPQPRIDALFLARPTASPSLGKSASTLALHRRAGHKALGKKPATNAPLPPHATPTTTGIIKEPAGVRRHGL